MYKTLEVTKTENAVYITLNEPKTLNALSILMREELKYCLDEVKEDKEIRVIVLTGKGNNFCSGGEISSMNDLKPSHGRKRMQNVQLLTKKIREIEKPFIAAVNGYAYGAGWTLALACDFIIATESSKFSMSFANIALVPDCGAMYLLPRIIGVLKTKELMLLAKQLDAKEALKLGLINEIVPQKELFEVVDSLVWKLSKGPTISYGLTKKILNKSFESDFETILELEAFAQDICFQTQDFNEGKTAFLKKREPNFLGE